MRFAVIACFAGGFLLGWWPIAKPLPSQTAGGSRGLGRKSRDLRSDTIPQASRSAVRIARDRVEIPRNQLENLVNLTESPALTCRDFPMAYGTPPPRSFEQLAKWCDLDAHETRRLAEILRQAAEARRIWERENIKVTSTATADWTLEIPSDDGQAVAVLRQQLAATFSPAKAAAIEAGGDLRNFFCFHAISPELQHGRVEVRARRLDATNHDLQLKIQAGDRSITVSLNPAWFDDSSREILIPGLPDIGELFKAASARATEK